MTYLNPHNGSFKISSTTFIDAAFNVSKRAQHGQPGLIYGIIVEGNVEGRDIYDSLDWLCHKQRQVCYYSYDAEVLACTDADYQKYLLKTAIRDMLPPSNCRHRLLVDCRGLFHAITALHEFKDYRLRHNVRKIKDSVDREKLDILGWLRGKANIVNKLVKHNPIMHWMPHKFI